MTSNNQYLRACIVLAGGLLLGGPVLVAGCAGQAEGPEALDEPSFDTLSEDLISNPLTPVLTCMDDLGRNNYRAHFGYTNSSTRSVSVPIGALNFFVPLPKNQGQPTSFAPGSHPEVFTVNFSTRDGWDRLAWWLSGRRALATRTTRLCAPPPPKCTSNTGCNDGLECTTDVCTRGVCSNAPLAAHTVCAHGNVCNGAGACVPCVSEVECNDGLECTADQCVNAQCAHPPVVSGTGCAHGGICDGSGSCLPPCASSADCDDSLECTNDVCNSGVCSHAPLAAHTVCAHGNVCDGAGACVPCVTALECDDGLECTTDQCVSAQCAHPPVAAGTSCAHDGTCDGAGSCL
jgi:hypothetical protein